MQSIVLRLMLSRRIFFTLTVCFLSLPVLAQQNDPKESPIIVQPGAPGKPSRILPADTSAKLPTVSAKDVEFMQGMIMHHAQAVEMTAMIESRSKNKEIGLLGAKISQSQSDEIKFMKRWLSIRGEKTEMQGMRDMDMDMSNMKSMDHSKHKPMLMPGMLSDAQMEALRNSTGAKFDELFLKGMIQHHEGALTMVKDLFKSAGAGQDAEIFNFTSDIDTGQRGEIKIMQELLNKKKENE